jgi:hypothetical protein
VFKKAAAKVQTVLQSAGYKVAINESKPRKGAFVVSLGSKTVIELLNMPRPFTKLRNTDVEEVIKAALEE